MQITNSGQTANLGALIAGAIDVVEAARSEQTGGKWLEELTVAASPYLRDWDIARCWPWAAWPERQEVFPGSTGQDIGIDCVAVRRSDGGYIAIQCKSRQLDEHGHGAGISKAEIDSFASASAGEPWAERWLVTNGDNRLSGNALQVAKMGDKNKPIKVVNIDHDLRQQQSALIEEACPHCEPNPEDDARRSKSCMQREAIGESVRILQEHERSASGGLPVGQARGKIILPCGTGKTRISLRIIEALTSPGQLSIVLCPSIALVAQIRREYLQHAAAEIRALAVCSDDTAGYNPKKKSWRNTADDPTVDNSNVSADEVKGVVSTDEAVIAAWISEGQGGEQVSVIFGTYQSGSRVAAALKRTGVRAQVLIADEAHRTAGLRKKRRARREQVTGAAQLTAKEQRIRDFTLCHDNDAFPAVYRVYQTATPRIYDTSKVQREQDSDWLVRSMDDETVFGVELYRKSYVEAVRNGWLADYRIIAVGVNGADAYDVANTLAGDTKSSGRNKLTTTHFLRGLAFALAMGGATQTGEAGSVPIKSCIAFMNTVDKSKNMVDDLQSEAARGWLQEWMREHRENRSPAQYRLQHLDASSNVARRDAAKAELARATEAEPHGIINVGIFGEGTDSPTLNAVAFLEARKSPIDVIQAVGRAMRTAPGKELGYIICPIVIPANADPETWLSVSDMEEGWSELGQILLALRAHDDRIENQLADLLQLYIPKPPRSVVSLIGIGGADKRMQYREHRGRPGSAEDAVERVVSGKSTLAREFRPIEQPRVGEDDEPGYEAGGGEPSQIITGKRHDDGSVELRMDSVVRCKPGADGAPGPVDIKKSKKQARKMVNEGAGKRVPPRRTREERIDSGMQLKLQEMGDEGKAISMNLLAKSGLADNRVARDLNLLEESVREAAHHLRQDELQPALDRHFGLDNLDEKKRKQQADGCTIAALLMMNAAMLHQRIANGGWLSDAQDLETVKHAAEVTRLILRQWHAIIGHDFKPVMEPAVRAIEAVEDTGRLAGLERALRHIAAEAARIAETYADMGADHAGPLFNRVMGNQASDGAFFTRPVAASIAARLTLDACDMANSGAVGSGAGGGVDWTDADVWRRHKIVDPACGSGTLLAAMLTDMKRRAREQGLPEARIAELQKLAVEDSIKGLDINPVSLQLAASQLTADNSEIRYRRMGLHLMPYGPHPRNAAQVSAGSLELLGQQAIVPRPRGRLGLADDRIKSEAVWNQRDDAELEDAVDAAQGTGIVIMNPPFTNRKKMGEKFPKAVQQALRTRLDRLEDGLIAFDPELKNFGSRNTVGPCFVNLADRCLPDDSGILTMINPSIALSATSGLNERRILAQRYHIHTVLTCHQPKNINLSQNTSINESIIVLRRYNSMPKPPTRFINLDRMPTDDVAVADLHRCLSQCDIGTIANGWGEVSAWPTERMEAGDWTPGIWRSTELAEAARTFATHSDMLTIREHEYSCEATLQMLDKKYFVPATPGSPGSFPIISLKGADGQNTIRSTPDAEWQPTNPDEEQRILNGGTYPQVDKLLKKAGYLLITSGQDTSTARLSAIADDNKYVGRGFLPVTGPTVQEAKAIAVFINSSAGRLQLLRNAGKKLQFPVYNPEPLENLRIPDVTDARIRQILADCWERSKDMVVPQFRDGECEVRRMWDEAVAEAMGWDADELGRLRLLLHREPHVRGLGYGQYADEAEADAEPASAAGR